MKKRLRKKKHLGEFVVFGRQFLIQRNTKHGLDEFFDRFITVIEANGCVCGGGGQEDHLDFIVELGRRDQNPDAIKAQIEASLLKDPSVKSVRIGEEFDVWYGDYVDIAENTKAEQAGGRNPA